MLSRLRLRSFAMLKVAADLDVIRIVSHHTDLEEVFLSYYQQDRT